jgi:hypothetical protein
VRLSEKEWKALQKKSNKIQGTGKTGAIHKSDQEAIIEREHNVAVQTLRNLQMFGGDLFLGRNDFDLDISIHGKTKADDSNVYKGVEDSLNKVAYRDDKQNRHFRRKFCGGGYN